MWYYQTPDITFFERGPADPSQQCKRASNNIQNSLPHWILTTFKLKFGGGNLFSLAMTSTIEGNNSVGSHLKPLLKKVTPVVGSRMLWTYITVWVKPRAPVIPSRVDCKMPTPRPPHPPWSHHHASSASAWPSTAHMGPKNRPLTNLYSSTTVLERQALNEQTGNSSGIMTEFGSGKRLV
jgi:hypothetical protein